MAVDVARPWRVIVNHHDHSVVAALRHAKTDLLLLLIKRFYRSTKQMTATTTCKYSKVCKWHI
jgi:hypothetical protein